MFSRHRITSFSRAETFCRVIRGKVENIQLPDDIKQVDIIVSEWMGYALLYESMLDSVLHARDRFLRPGGVMAPSQTKMMLGLCDAADIFKERVAFWSDIYGKDISSQNGTDTDVSQALIFLQWLPMFTTTLLSTLSAQRQWRATLA